MAGYQYNYGAGDYPEVNSSTDSFNGQRGAMRARTNQQTQSSAQSSSDPYQAFQNAAMSWRRPQIAPTATVAPTQTYGTTQAAGSPYTAQSIARAIAPTAINDSGDPSQNRDIGPSVPPPGTTPPPTTTPPPSGTPTTPSGRTLTPVTTPGDMTYDPSTGQWVVPGGNPVPNQPTPPPVPTDTQQTPPPGGNPISQTPPPNLPPFQFPDPNQVMAQVRQALLPGWQLDHANLDRSLMAQAAETGAINSGGFAEARARAHAQLQASEDSDLANKAFQASQTQAAQQLTKYGIDNQTAERVWEFIQSQPLEWAKLQASLYQGDQNAAIAVATIASTLGIDPATLANILKGFAPAQVFVSH